MYEYFVHHKPTDIIQDGYHDIIIEKVVFYKRIDQSVHIYIHLKILFINQNLYSGLFSWWP